MMCAVSVHFEHRCGIVPRRRWCIRFARIIRLGSWCVALLIGGGNATRAAAGPATVEELWRDYDPRAVPLRAETIDEGVADGVTLRTVMFTAEVVDGYAVRMLA